MIKVYRKESEGLLFLGEVIHADFANEIVFKDIEDRGITGTKVRIDAIRFSDYVFKKNEEEL